MAAKRSPELDAEIASLYSLPLAEFTPARNTLSARLRREGDREASERVKGLAKPTASAWAVNVLFRDETEKMDALLAAGAAAHRALGDSLRQGAAESLRRAIEEERGHRDALRRRAEAILTKAGGAPGRAIVDRVGTNLEALALNPAAAEAAERRWLDRDLDPPGFEVMAGLQLGARPERRGLRLVPSPAETKEKDKKSQGEDREQRAERERREREEAKLRERIARAEEKVEHLESEVESLSKEAGRAEKSAAEAERAAGEARRRAETARQAADRAAERLKRAEADLEGLQ
ncbi:MAG TPA: alanine-zipper protein [Thermoanaerobaculia bacterium]